MDGPLSRAALLDAIGFKNEYRSYQRHIVRLIDQGLVAMTNPENPKASTQGYVLTEIGRQALTSLEGNR